ncbi:unnamed protein product [Linum trigynum]|uniref:Uncharacterized protein n=1 Tax=Linum trigynum TaxID=586398 RepID=A0AAV2D9Y5_9ROSI
MPTALRLAVPLHTQTRQWHCVTSRRPVHARQLLRYVSPSSSGPNILDQLLRYVSPSSSDLTIYCVQ